VTQKQVAEVLMNYIRAEQAIVRAAAGIPQRINDVLGRSQPLHVLTAADVALHHTLVGLNYEAHALRDAGGRLPNLMDELEVDLGLRVAVGAGTIEILEPSDRVRRTQYL
jgi:hypothetical protein